MVRFVTVVAVCIGLVWGCSQREDHPQRDADFLLIGVAPDYPPFESVVSETGEITGFDIDLIMLICQANRWRFEIVPTPFEDLFGDLHDGDIDIAISAITVNPKREVLVAFSDPYYLTGQAVVVPITDTTTSDLADLRGKRVGVMRGTTGEELAKQTDGVLVFSYDEIRSALAALADGDLEAVINDKPTTRALIGNDNSLRMLPGTLNSEYYGIAMRTGDTVRLKILNDALAALLGGYTYERLHARWFGYPPMDIAVPDSVAAQWPAE